MSTAEVTEQVPIKRPGVLRRLRNLEEEIEYEGETYIKRKVNPSLKAGHRIHSKDLKLMRELRVYGTPDGLPWPEQ